MGEPLQIKNVIRNAEGPANLFALIIQVEDEKGVVWALVQENNDVPRFRSAEVTTKDSISLAKDGDYLLKMLVVDDLESPGVFAYADKSMKAYDPETQREPKGAGHGFPLKIKAKGPLQ